jgi:hypothetical protein
MTHFDGAHAVADIGTLPELTEKRAGLGELVDQGAQAAIA